MREGRRALYRHWNGMRGCAHVILPACLRRPSARAPNGAAAVPAAGGEARPARAAGAGSSRGSRSGRRWRRRLRQGRHSPTWPRPPGPARPLRPDTDLPTGGGRGGVGTVVQPTAGQCGRGISPLPASDWLSLRTAAPPPRLTEGANGGCAPRGAVGDGKMAAGSSGGPGAPCRHHAQLGACESRAKYREGWRPRAVKVGGGLGGCRAEPLL